MCTALRSSILGRRYEALDDPGSLPQGTPDGVASGFAPRQWIGDIPLLWSLVSVGHTAAQDEKRHLDGPVVRLVRGVDGKLRLLRVLVRRRNDRHHASRLFRRSVQDVDRSVWVGADGDPTDLGAFGSCSPRRSRSCPCRLRAASNRRAWRAGASASHYFPPAPCSRISLMATRSWPIRLRSSRACRVQHAPGVGAPYKRTTSRPSSRGSACASDEYRESAGALASAPVSRRDDDGEPDKRMRSEK